MGKSFEDVFGFNPGGCDQAAKVVGSMGVEIKIGYLARKCEVAGWRVGELARVLKKEWDGRSPGSLDIFASIFAEATQDRIAADEAFYGAMKLAKEAGFTVNGMVEDMEVERIFHLKSFHKPLTGPEGTQVRKILSALAGDLDLACQNERYASSGSDVECHNKVMEEVAEKKPRFWDAHALAKKIGVQVHERYQDHCPWAGSSYWTSSDKEYFIETAKEKGLI